MRIRADLSWSALFVEAAGVAHWARRWESPGCFDASVVSHALDGRTKSYGNRKPFQAPPLWVMFHPPFRYPHSPSVSHLFSGVRTDIFRSFPRSVISIQDSVTRRQSKHAINNKGGRANRRHLSQKKRRYFVHFGGVTIYLLSNANWRVKRTFQQAF